MKKLVFLIIIVFLFIVIFIKSNTWEISVETENREDNEYLVTKHSIHWDRFFNYVKDIPIKIVNSLPH